MPEPNNQEIADFYEFYSYLSKIITEAWVHGEAHFEIDIHDEPLPKRGKVSGGLIWRSEKKS